MAKDLSVLEKKAAKIPSMGGLAAGPALREAASRAMPGTAVVEVGSWLGAGTAQLALGLVEAGKDNPLHVFDRWLATPSEVEKAKTRKGLDLARREDTLPIVKKYMSPFGADIHYHQGEVLDAEWAGPAISVYVDDAAKAPPYFLHVLKTFGPWWVPGKTEVLLMDYNMYRRHPEKKDLHCQKEFVEAHSSSFEVIQETMKGSSLAWFRYLGGVDFASLDF